MGAEALPAGVAGSDWCTSPTFAGWVADPVWNEFVTTFTLLDGVVVHVNAPAQMCARRAAPTRLVLYALPNGNSIAWTVGKRVEPGDDWHFGIQHIGAQARLARKLSPEENIVVAYAEAPGRSWPAWRRKHGEKAPQLARKLVEQVARRFTAWRPQIELVAHSGGGSLLFAFIEEGDEISSEVRRFVFLDANYGFSQEAGHGARLAQWLHDSPDRVLVVAAYDDRGVTLNGKPVVGPTGGTWRATQRLMADLGARDGLTTVTVGELVDVRGFGGRLRVALHRNTERRILHTVLVERNGFVWGVLAATLAEARAPAFFSEPAYGRLLGGSERP
jgi:hypothetical protein